ETCARRIEIEDDLSPDRGTSCRRGLLMRGTPLACRHSTHHEKTRTVRRNVVRRVVLFLDQVYVGRKVEQGSRTGERPRRVLLHAFCNHVVRAIHEEDLTRIRTPDGSGAATRRKRPRTCVHVGEW